MAYQGLSYLSNSSSAAASASPARSLGFTILGESFAYVNVFLFLFVCLFVVVVFFYPTLEVVTFISSSWMLHAGCVFVACIHPFRT